MKTLLLSAGKGERLRPLTDTIPKPLVEVCGKKLIDYNLDLLKEYELNDVVVNVSYLADQIINYLGNRVLFSYEKEIMGTAGAVFKLMPWFDANFLVMNSDTIHKINLNRMLKSHLDSNAVVTIFTKDNDIHNGGAFIFSYRIFYYLNDNIKSIHEDLIPLLNYSDINLYGMKNEDEYYFDIGTVEKLKIAEDYLNQK
jgi:NDP-sugar pyrophosphorylase family protein